MKKIFLIWVSLALLISSCNNSKPQVAKGDRMYGGVLRINEIDIYQSLFPASITDVSSSHIANQIYEGLVKFNPKDLNIIPSLAEKWEVDATGTVYTFHLKKGVFFHDNECFTNGKGREVTASDFKYSFELLCTDMKENLNFAATFKNKIVGANKFFETSKGKPNGEIEGIKVIDDYTLKITLIAPSTSFLSVLALPTSSVIAKEAYEKYGSSIVVGTGPFLFIPNNNNDKNNVVLIRNNNYHGIDSLGNQLPFLDSVIISATVSKKAELENFENGNLSMVTGLPSESIKDLVENEISNFQSKTPKYILVRSPEMGSQYYELNLTKPPFNNIKVRQAFAYAINRTKIVEDILKGEAYGPAVNGLCPPTFKGYDITKIKGYDFNPELAKKLLKEAGYPDGKDFPKVKIELNSGGVKNTNVVLEVQKQLLDVLNINIDFEVVSQKQKLEDEQYALAEMFRAAWIADFPSPENFLWMAYGANVPNDITQPSFPNSTRYKSEAFDKLFEAGIAAKTQEESYSYFLQAEQQLMDDCPIIVLWYEENYRLLKSNVHNFYFNPMRYRDYSQVYIKDLAPVVAKEEVQ